MVYVRLFADEILNPSVVPFELIRQAMLDEHRPERPCRAEVNLAIEVDVAEFPITDVEVSTIHLGLVVEEPVRRSDNAGPGLDFQRDELCRPFQNGRWLDRALVGELHDKPPTRRPQHLLAPLPGRSEM